MIGNERIEAYIESLACEKTGILIEIEKEALLEHVPIIKRPTQNLLKFLIRNQNPLNILEVGTAVGFSAILMSEYMKDDGQITTIERMTERIKKAKVNFEKCGKTNKINLLEGDATKILSKLSDEEPYKYDFIFMDAAKGQYINFLPDLMKLLKTGGLLVSDNVLQDGDVVQSRYGVTRRKRTIHTRMREYLYVLTHSKQLDTIVLPIGDGVTLSTKLNIEE